MTTPRSEIDFDNPDEWAVDMRTDPEGNWIRSPMKSEDDARDWIGKWQRGGVIKQVRLVRIFVDPIEEL